MTKVNTDKRIRKERLQKSDFKIKKELKMKIFIHFVLLHVSKWFESDKFVWVFTLYAAEIITIEMLQYFLYTKIEMRENLRLSFLVVLNSDFVIYLTKTVILNTVAASCKLIKKHILIFFSP